MLAQCARRSGVNSRAWCFRGHHFRVTLLYSPNTTVRRIGTGSARGALPRKLQVFTRLAATEFCSTRKVQSQSRSFKPSEPAPPPSAHLPATIPFLEARSEFQPLLVRSPDAPPDPFACKPTPDHPRPSSHHSHPPSLKKADAQISSTRFDLCVGRRESSHPWSRIFAYPLKPATGMITSKEIGFPLMPHFQLQHRAHTIPFRCSVRATLLYPVQHLCTWCTRRIARRSF